MRFWNKEGPDLNSKKKTEQVVFILDGVDVRSVTISFAGWNGLFHSI